MADGGWNCEQERGSTRGSFNTTINVLEGLLAHERATGGSPIRRRPRPSARISPRAPAAPPPLDRRDRRRRLRAVRVPDRLQLRRAAGARLLLRRRRHGRTRPRRSTSSRARARPMAGGSSIGATRPTSISTWPRRRARPAAGSRFGRFGSSIRWARRRSHRAARRVWSSGTDYFRTRKRSTVAAPARRLLIGSRSTAPLPAGENGTPPPSTTGSR